MKDEQYIRNNVKITKISDFISLVFKAINRFNKLENHKFKMSVFHYIDEDNICYACIGGATGMYVLKKTHVGSVAHMIGNRISSNDNISDFIESLEYGGEDLRTGHLFELHVHLKTANDTINVGYNSDLSGEQREVLMKLQFDVDLHQRLSVTSTTDIKKWKELVKKEVLPELRKAGL